MARIVRRVHILRPDGDDLVDGDDGGRLGDQGFALRHPVHVGDVEDALDLPVRTFLPDDGLPRGERGVDDGLRGERHRFRTGLLAVGDAPDPQDGLRAVLLYADPVLLVQNDALGIQDRRGRQLAVGGLRTLAVGDDGHRAVLVDDQTAGELAVDIVDVHGDPGRFVLIGLEESEQLVGAGGHRPERHLLAVDGDGGLIGAAHGDHVMVAQAASGCGGDLIVGLDVHALVPEQPVDGHGVGGDRGGFAIDVQCNRFAGGQGEGGGGGDHHGGCADGHSDTAHRRESFRRPSSGHDGIPPVVGSLPLHCIGSSVSSSCCDAIPVHSPTIRCVGGDRSDDDPSRRGAGASKRIKEKGGGREGDVPAPLYRRELVGGRSVRSQKPIVGGGRPLDNLLRGKISTQTDACLYKALYDVRSVLRASCRDRTDDLPLTRRPLWPSELRRRVPSR